jgi:hypothetical protein
MRPCDENPTAFASSRALFEAMLNGLAGEVAGLSHGELEEWLDAKGRELQRQMYQDSLDLRALREARLEAVVGADGMSRGSVESGHHRGCIRCSARWRSPGSPTADAAAPTCTRPTQC